MKSLKYPFILILVTIYSLCHAQDTIRNKVSFVAKIDIQQATKDGIYLNGYVVSIPYQKLAKLDGRTVRIIGTVTIVKGLKHYKDNVERQGRENDTKHILDPIIVIVDK